MLASIQLQDDPLWLKDDTYGLNYARHGSILKSMPCGYSRRGFLPGEGKSSSAQVRATSRPIGPKTDKF
eukprot:940471-Pyramimonas_sp.AAC.1